MTTLSSKMMVGKTNDDIFQGANTFTNGKLLYAKTFLQCKWNCWFRKCSKTFHGQCCHSKETEWLRMTEIYEAVISKSQKG